ncbi:hypothetical protein ACJ41O_003205 [Fusarium nematophilum]
MSEWSGFIYAAAAPLPTFSRRTQGEKEWQRPETPLRSNSNPQQDPNRSRRPFRHTRSSSGSQGSRSSHESTLLQSSSPAAGGDDSRHLHHAQYPPKSTVVSSDSRLSTSTHHSNKSLLNLGSGTTASSIFFNRPLASDRNRHRDRRYHHPETPSSVDLKNVVMYSQLDASNKPMSGTTKQISIPFARTESVSSASGTTTLSSHTMTSTDPSNTSDNSASKPFIVRNGRTYFNDPTSAYPLPTDLTELHRQCLRTLLLIQVYGAPVFTPSLRVNPPQRVLELGCGTGFWSMMCHRYFKERGHSGISFTGVDIAPLAPGSAGAPLDVCKPDKDMNWRFVQHDLRQFPWPFGDDEFDLIMVKDVSLIVPNWYYQGFLEEYLRCLKPGGVLELWDSDATLRMLRPHVPSAKPGSEEAEDHEAALDLGAYLMTAKTPLSAPLNTFLVEYNNWLSRTLEARQLSPVPCSLIGACLLQEPETLMEVRSKRMAIPLSEVRWEREGVGGVVTKDGKSYVEMKAKATPHQKVEKKTLTAGQSALRRTALLVVAQQIQALEPILRETSGKNQDEWDLWVGKMLADLMSESGTSWGECLEVGAWSAKKRFKPET